MCAVAKEYIAGRAARFVYDCIVDRDLIVLADNVASLPEPPKQSQKSSKERAADAIQKMSNLLGKSEHLLSSSCLAIETCNSSWPPGSSRVPEFLSTQYRCVELIDEHALVSRLTFSRET